MSHKGDLFVKTDLELLALGLPSRLLHLYGRLRLHANRSGQCYAKHSTLAKEVGLQTDRQVRNLLDQLRRLRLITWRRGRYCNRFVVHDPDRKFISALTGNGFPLSDRKSISDRKEAAARKEASKTRSRSPKPSAPPATPPGRLNAGTQNAAAAASPEEAFRQLLRERHGSRFDVDGCIRSVKRQLFKSSGLEFADFAAFDLEQTTNQNLRNPGGYYVNLVKEFSLVGRRTAAEIIEKALRGATHSDVQEPPKNANGWCSRCGGPGKLPEGGFCDCAMGRDLAALEKRKPKSETKPPTEGKGAA